MLAQGLAAGGADLRTVEPPGRSRADFVHLFGRQFGAIAAAKRAVGVTVRHASLGPDVLQRLRAPDGEVELAAQPVVLDKVKIEQEAEARRLCLVVVVGIGCGQQVLQARLLLVQSPLFFLRVALTLACDLLMGGAGQAALGVAGQGVRAVAVTEEIAERLELFVTPRCEQQGEPEPVVGHGVGIDVLNGGLDAAQALEAVLRVR